ncbi:SIMPL domain-containing protein [Zobellia barbeyronii]|uniref:SIMPL domain-containing protein n=1 Tax=Zobellia barbeyronii TaxID=2748009 RepID=A0ABS5WF18_9FLAO|nr:SIMPL domain-containing protein [Zobellia barbeyronii]MBT2161979.1 SIMPL domain-containing protein [Zobellia barbeyronii]
MKKVITSIALMVFSFMAFAQNNLQNNINVNGAYEFSIAPEYSSKMIVSLNNVYYDTQTMNLEEVKTRYMENLTKAGIEKEQLKEVPLYYALLGYEKEGTVYEFKTKSLEEMQKFLNVKAIGVTRSDTNLEAQLSDMQMAEYAKLAFDDAKAKATAIAQKIGRKIGKAIYINDTNSQKIVESMYYGNSEQKKMYYLSVSFELL